MKDPRLEIRRTDNTSKCCNCAFWGGRDSPGNAVAECALLQVRTLDLAVCSQWELHEVHQGQIIGPHD